MEDIFVEIESVLDILSNRIFHPLGIFAVSILAPKLSVLVTFLELVSTWWHECHCPVTLVLVSQLTCCGVAFPYILSKSETLLFSVKCGFLNNFLFLIIGKTFPDKWWIRGFLFEECPNIRIPKNIAEITTNIIFYLVLTMENKSLRSEQPLFWLIQQSQESGNWISSFHSAYEKKIVTDKGLFYCNNISPFSPLEGSRPSQTWCHRLCQWAWRCLDDVEVGA